ncbi:MAG: minC, partial [Clostridiales bacterium]|nr:minC [Clostridiales bacterium]
MSLVTIKGSKEGLTAYINYGNYEDIKEELLKKIEHSKSFFTGSNMLIVDQAKLSSDYCVELGKILRDSFGINTSFESKDFSEKSEKTFSGIYEGKTKFIKNSIRSGQRVNFNGNVVVIGDVNSGGEIIAA